ncbi:heme/hemin ABC transporter substrate-binding protein [Cellulosimicrobium arenosum]|uniref:ABC transporter substrate-binding protein n=1 Tax=Cellulosimicrobium arenosum TaxID=2708133 RepID=A0A927PG61_9MICO|nr:ABC transporter substrate-binding protein [Cellulosimicrobium arenosum]MBD8080075.1 ABC transporter substrate-binding protein [Cellulosimicrobium arenosum]
MAVTSRPLAPRGRVATPSRSRAPRLRSRVLAVLGLPVVLAALLAGCGSVGAGTSEAAAVAPSRPLSELEPVDDPRSWVGESTAVLAAEPIEPVTTDAQPDLPVTLTDAQGTEVTVTDTSRILALDLYGTTSRIAFELGLGDQVVGRDTSSTFAEIADEPLVTANGHELSAEAILELAPTVIITDTTLGPWDVVLQMRDAGIPVVVVDSHRSLETVGPLVQQVADALGVSAQGTELAERVEGEIAATRAQIDEIVPADEEGRLRMVFLYVRGQAGVYYMFGSGSGADSLITSLGGVDVATEIGWDGMRPVNDEGLVAAQPDLVLVMTKGLESVGGVDGLLEQLPALAQTPAGEHRRVVDMADSSILSYGPDTARVLDALAGAVYAPEATP